MIRESCTTSKDTGLCVVRLEIPDYWFNSSYNNALLTFKQETNEKTNSIQILSPFFPASQQIVESSVYLIAPSTTYYSDETFYVDGFIYVAGFTAIESMEVVIHANTNFAPKSNWIIPSAWIEVLCKLN